VTRNNQVLALKETIRKVKDNLVKGAAQGLAEGLFEDYYAHRYRVYWMNLVRGIWFGFGTVVGGTIVVALLLWVLSFLGEVPFVGHFVQSFQNSVQQR
jgi:hypothetical protein